VTAAAAARLGSEGFAQQKGLNYVTEFSTDSRNAKSSVPADHVSHACCLDPDPRTGRGVKSLMAWGRDLDPETGALRRNGRALVIARRCNTWSCFCCAVMLRRKAQRHVFLGAKTGRLFFVTLTIDPKDRRWRKFRDEELHKAADRLQSGRLGSDGWPEYWRTAVTRASVRYVAKSWNHMATLMRRDSRLAELLEVGPDGRNVIPFVRALELQKNGRAHLHVLIRVPTLAHGFANRKVLRELAVTAGFGDGMGFDMQAAGSRSSLVVYVTKGAALAGYIAKAGDILPRHARRFSYSASWSEWTRATRIAGWWDWRLAGGAPATITRALEASGFVIEDPGRHRVSSAGTGDWTPAGGLQSWHS